MDAIEGVLVSSPPVIWTDLRRRRLWCDFVATEVLRALSAHWQPQFRQAIITQEVLSADLYGGPAPRTAAAERVLWARMQTQAILRRLGLLFLAWTSPVKPVEQCSPLRLNAYGAASPAARSSSAISARLSSSPL
jgi:hypothetical protein